LNMDTYTVYDYVTEEVIGRNDNGVLVRVWSVAK
jgi:hypothetical protein